MQSRSRIQRRTGCCSPIGATRPPQQQSAARYSMAAVRLDERRHSPGLPMASSVNVLHASSDYQMRGPNDRQLREMGAGRPPPCYGNAQVRTPGGLRRQRNDAWIRSEGESAAAEDWQRPSSNPVPPSIMRRIDDGSSTTYVSPEAGLFPGCLPHRYSDGLQ